MREPQSHLAILKAIGAGAHTLDAISNATLIGKTHLSAYLVRLQDLNQIWSRIQQDLRAFIGQTAFEDLARAWVLAQGQANRLPFAPEVIGSHWSRHVQADVVAVNWREHAILIGECKWSTDRVDRQIVRDLIEGKTPLILRDLPNAGQGWTITYACFARGGFTDAARQLIDVHQGLCVDLEMLIATCPECS